MKKLFLIKAALIAVPTVGVLVFILWQAGVAPFARDTAPAPLPATLTLGLSPEMLPEGVTMDDVIITSLPLEELDDNLRRYDPIAVFDLVPHGLVLRGSVPFKLTVPLIEEGQTPLLYHFSDDAAPPEAIGEIALAHDFDAGTTIISGNLTHFSRIVYRLWKKIDTEQISNKEILEECAQEIGALELECSQHENWELDVMLSHTDWLNRASSFYDEEFIVGPNNQCLGTRAGDTYPLRIKSKFLDYQGLSETVCSVACYAWTCPAGEADLEQTFTCREGTIKTDECLRTCDTTANECVKDATQFDCSVCSPIKPRTPVEPPPPAPVCDLVAFDACAKQCESPQACIDRCPFLPVECPPDSPPDVISCAELDENCSYGCLDTANACIDACLQESSCRLEEIPPELTPS